MAQKKRTVNVQIDRRQDGRISSTVKLIAWDLNELRALIAQLQLSPLGRWVAQELGPALQAELKELRALADANADEPIAE